MEYRHWEYMQAHSGQSVKFMPSYDGPYTMTCANPSESIYTLHLPNKPNCFPTIHSSPLHKFIDNDHTMFSACSLVMPGTINTAEGEGWLVKLE
jgi:hypothetical protein